jgi:hypothetical protein
MKSKIHKILGVAVTLAMVLTLAVAFTAPVAANPDETINEWYKFAYPEEGADGDWFYDQDIQKVSEITQAINGDLYVYASISGLSEEILKSEDGGRTWALTNYSDPVDGVEGGYVFDIVCSSIDEDIVYVTDGCYVYKTDDGGDTWTFLAKDSLETMLGGVCGCDICNCSSEWRTISSLDVTYDADDNPFVFIGTRAHSARTDTGCTDCKAGPYPGDVLYIAEGGYPANWTSLNLPCFHGGGYEALAVGCAPDWADTKETYVVVTTDNDASDPGMAHTWVVYTKGTVCGWYEFAELLWNCQATNHFESYLASRIGFPDDWADTETLFVGVADKDGTHCTGLEDRGGDVYLATDGDAIDLNVAGIVTGCQGEKAVDIISLDVKGDTDEAALIAGAYCDSNVYYSTDGGWSWDESEKDPTGEGGYTYVIWYEDTALATTDGYECAVSMSCGEEVGQYWNQISLINTGIDCVIWGDHSPGYLSDDSHTLFLVTNSYGTWSQSVFRYDGTYWERVFCSTIADGVYFPPFEWLEVSPDFLTTNCVVVGNSNFEIWRTLDAGCSWDKLTFPCAPRPRISAAVIIDEDTGLAGGAGSDAGTVFKTTRHGARPWDDYEVDTEGDAVSFALEPGYEDPGSVLLGTDESEVFISEDGGETWDLVGDWTDVFDADKDAYVIFDPGYATNHIIYAAAGATIARCTIDPDADWADQEWKEINFDFYGDPIYLDVAHGIQAVGDTALYVTDDHEAVYQGPIYYGGVLRSLNPDAEDAEDVVFERIGPGLLDDKTELNGLLLTTDVSDDGCAENVLWSLDSYDCENVWVYEDTLAAPVVLNTPVEGQKLATTDEATLSWTALCDADCYEVSLYSYCAECPDEKLEVEICGDCGGALIVIDDFVIDDLDHRCLDCVEDTCIVVGDEYDEWLEPGTTYYWKVRVCYDQPHLSKWSEERSFTTALIPVPFDELCSPDCGSQNIILTPNFAWEAVDGATGYEVQLATTETFTVGVVKGKTTVNAWVCPETLDYASTYYWRVRAEKDGIYSDWTYCMFTTMTEPVPPTPPVEVVVPPAQPAPVINIPPTEMITPTWIYAIIGVGAALAIVVIVLIVRARRPQV